MGIFIAAGVGVKGFYFLVIILAIITILMPSGPNGLV